MTAYNGPLGKLLHENVWELPVGNFTAIPVAGFTVLPDIVVKRMSTDAQTLYKLCFIATTGSDEKSSQVYVLYLQIMVFNMHPLLRTVSATIS